MLQFITNETAALRPAQQILEVIDGGCRWVQIRLKNASDDEIKQLFHEIREKAKETLTTVIINDRVELAKSMGEEGVAGVHLGKTDMNAAMARELLGPEAIIGVTAHSFDELLAYKGLDVDYVGIGPFAHTETKKDLAPLLGIEGIADLTVRAKEGKIDLPLVAVGGIRLDDVQPLLAVGVNGIAVSGAIANSVDIVTETRNFLNELPIEE